MPQFSKHLYFITAVILIAAAIGYAYSVFRPSSRRERWVNEFVANYKSEPTAAPLDPNKCTSVLARAKSMIEAGYDSSHRRKAKYGRRSVWLADNWPFSNSYK